MKMFTVTCKPFEQGSIRSMTIIIYAQDRKEAELIRLRDAHRFFNQDMHFIWDESPLKEG